MSKDMVKGNRPDYIFLVIVTFLIVLGGLILFSVSASISQEKFGSIFHYLNHQILYGFLPGLILAFLVFRMNLKILKKWAPVLLLTNLVFLIMVFVPQLGLSVRGASRWLNLGIVSFQPSEFLKLTFILYLASWLDSRGKKINLPKSKKNFSRTLIAFLIIISFIGLLLIFQPDISTLGIILATSALMFFLANTPLRHTVLIILIIIICLPILVKIAPYRMARILVFLNPEIDPMGMGYQIKQSLIAVGSGGVYGSGFGLSEQKFGFLPQSVSDSIFAIFAEEAGFIGSFVLILLFLFFFWQGFQIGKRKKDKFPQLLAWGITFWITFQALINIGSMIGILPLTGIPLPFISYGGSALISELVGIGILLNISKQ